MESTGQLKTGKMDNQRFQNVILVIVLPCEVILKNSPVQLVTRGDSQ